MATLNIQKADESGNDLTMTAAAAGGDQFPNNGKQELIIRNGSAGAITVTAVAQNTSFDDQRYGLSVKQNQSVSVSAGGVGVMRNFPIKPFNDANGNIQITYSGVTSLTVAVVEGS